jgi:hypothetical protein
MTRAWFDHAISTPQSAKHWNLQSLASSHCGLTPSPECGIRNLLRMVKLWLVAEKIIAWHCMTLHDIEYIEYSNSDKLIFSTHIGSIWVGLILWARVNLCTIKQSLNGLSDESRSIRSGVRRPPQASAGSKARTVLAKKPKTSTVPPMEQSCKKGDQHGSEMVRIALTWPLEHWSQWN